MILWDFTTRGPIRKIWAIIAQDLREYHVVLGMQVVGPSLFGLFMIAWMESSQLPSLFVALMFSVNLSPVIVLPTILLLREKNRRVWTWLRCLTGHRAILIGAKFVLFSSISFLTLVLQWPTWQRALSHWPEGVRLTLWRHIGETMWVLGCIAFTVTSLARGSLKRLFLLIVSFYHAIGLSIVTLSLGGNSNELPEVSWLSCERPWIEFVGLVLITVIALLLSIRVERDTD